MRLSLAADQAAAWLVCFLSGALTFSILLTVYLSVSLNRLKKKKGDSVRTSGNYYIFGTREKNSQSVMDFHMKSNWTSSCLMLEAGIVENAKDSNQCLVHWFWTQHDAHKHKTNISLSNSSESHAQLPSASTTNTQVNIVLLTLFSCCSLLQHKSAN